MILVTAPCTFKRASKPRASGDDPLHLNSLYGKFAVNPARAGMILRILPGLLRLGRKPRASGDDPASGHDAPVIVQ